MQSYIMHQIGFVLKKHPYYLDHLKFLHKILMPYNYDVTILADRGFKSIDLFQFIDEDLN
jgi:hypothetical protein